MMISVRSRLFLFCILAAFGPASLQAQQISGIEGESRTGQILTIMGLDFGQKSGPEPLMWDDLSHYQGLSDYQQVPVGGDNPWPHPSYYTPEPYFFSSPDSVRVPGRPLYGATRKGGYFGGDDYNLGDNSTFTCNYWFWFSEYPPNLGQGQVTKLIRFWSANTTPYAGMNLHLSCTLNGTYRGFTGGFIPKETWNHFQVVIHNNSGMTPDPATTQAYYDVFLNGQKAHQTQPLVGDPANGGDISYLHRFGFDVRGAGFYDDWPETEIIRFGDIYVDNSVAHVIVANTQDYRWDNPTPVHWEIQPLVDWNPDSITVQFNAGSFENGEEVNLFVINSNGEISNPWPVVIDEDNELFMGPPTIHTWGSN